MKKKIKIDGLSLDISEGPNWSKLPSELLNLVFERLGFADFQRAKSVCSSWLSTSKQSTSKIQNLCLILFPEKGKDYCLLCNPEENYKKYRIQDLGDNFANSNCLAIYGSWVFMQDPRSIFYIMNLFTRERIDMPSLESQFGNIFFLITNETGLIVDFRRNVNMCVTYFCNNYNSLLSFWIDDKTKDYVVIWTFIHVDILFYTKKGENYWKQIKCDKLIDIVHKDHKLYLYNFYRDVKVFDISGDIPRHDKTLLWEIAPCYKREMKSCNLVVTVTGEILVVTNKISTDDDCYFSIHKLDSSNNKWEKLTSLGDEAILLDLGITVHANSIKGVNRNSIYYSGRHYHYTALRKYEWNKNDTFIFNLDTHKVERLNPSIYSGIQASDARWFVTNIKQK